MSDEKLKADIQKTIGPHVRDAGRRKVAGVLFREGVELLRASDMSDEEIKIAMLGLAFGRGVSNALGALSAVTRLLGGGSRGGPDDED